MPLAIPKLRIQAGVLIAVALVRVISTIIDPIAQIIGMKALPVFALILSWQALEWRAIIGLIAACKIQTNQRILRKDGLSITIAAIVLSVAHPPKRDAFVV